MADEFSRYLSGELLYGDDFTIEEIDAWYSDEVDGYANLGAKDRSRYSYGYHQLNQHHGFRHLKGMHFNNVLGYGSAYGDEFKPIAKNISKVTILDPSDAFSNTKEIFGLPCLYLKPNPNGDLEFKDDHFDLISSFGVMHHIPNVSHVLAECNRCLSKGGIMLLREPIISMGDWRKPRTGLTKRERGIPLHLLDAIIMNAGFTISHRALCNFPIVPRLASKFGVSAYNNQFLTAVDALLSQIFSWNIKYHRTKFLEKLAPASIYYVLTK